MIRCESFDQTFFHYQIRNCEGLGLLRAENKVITEYLLADASRSNLSGEIFLAELGRYRSYLDIEEQNS